MMARFCCRLDFLVLFLALLEYLEGYAPSGDANKACQSNAHVCTSLMKYPDETVFDEGPYCHCSGCHGDWKVDDWMSMSWPHYERADQSVQYRFCVPIIPQRKCDDGDLAITIETETDQWSPHVRDARCACPDHMYQLAGWWRHPTQSHDNKTGLWIYEYFCEKKDVVYKTLPHGYFGSLSSSDSTTLSSNTFESQCATSKSLCAKIYVDHHDDLTLGYNFLCACPLEYKCPSRLDDEEKQVETDSRGTFIPKYCEPVHKGMRRKL